MIVTKDAYTDQFFQARRRDPMSVAAEIQWSPAAPAVDDRSAGRGGRDPGARLRRGRRQLRLRPQRRRPARGRCSTRWATAWTPRPWRRWPSAPTATPGAPIRACPRCTRSWTGPSLEQFGPDHFVTAQMMRPEHHHRPAAVGQRRPSRPAADPRPRRVVGQLESPTTLPVGFGGEEPRISEQLLRPGDRVLCFTDGLIEEHQTGGEQFGEERSSAGPTASSATSRTGVRAVAARALPRPETGTGRAHHRRRDPLHHRVARRRRRPPRGP